MSNPLQRLSEEAGQAPWLDYLHRKILHDGELERLIGNDGLRGLTSNPSIFEKAIGEGDAYDAGLEAALKHGDAEVVDLYEGLAISDIQGAADLIRPLYDRLGGADGFVSLEVSPYLGLDTEGSIQEARRLWRAVDRPNVMIKVPGTPQGVPAIRQLIGEGINVNVTLLFALQAYREVAEAYIAGLEALKAGGREISKVASVASFFVSRIDTAIDKKIDQRMQTGDSEADALKAVRGKVAIANAKVAYQHYLELIASPRWKALEAAGARPQRLLWASTGTKDPSYPDTLYVDSLIGPDTVNTMPPATMDAFRDHGTVAETLAADLDAARQVLAEAQRLGLDLDGVTQELVTDGVDKFSEAFDQLLGAVASKRSKMLGEALDAQSIQAGPLQADYDAALKRAAHEGWIRRFWKKDSSLWAGGDGAKWLGWLDAAGAGCVDLPLLEGLRDEVHKAGFADAVLLGMGGSSLGPEVLAQTFGAQAGYPKLTILDSTDPAQVERIAALLDPARTLFIVSSKSGTTLEPDVLHRYFFEFVERALGEGKAGARFIAITDPGSKLEETARAQGFWRIFPGEPTIGGRYSVLSNFGMVPAAVMGLDVRRLFETVATMKRSCGPSVPPAANPGVSLGCLLGVGAKAGRDKVSLIVSDGIGDIGAWLEQLIAESTGKNGKGLIPIAAEPLGRPEVYGADRVFAYLRLDGRDDPARDGAVRALEDAGHPVVRITLASREMIFQEFFRWEVAIATAGAVIGIDPFDQPDVEASKIKTRSLTDDYEKSGQWAAEAPVIEDANFALFADAANAKALSAAAGSATVEAWLRAHFDRAGPGDYVALLAYIDHTRAHVAALQALRERLRDSRKVATALEFGPRFLHSTGQAYKGGPNSGVFLQITARDRPHLAIPGRKADFGIVVEAEARGDFEVLNERGRRALRLQIAGDVEAGLARLSGLFERALG
ncbi:MAG TPA: bifunctional transaldolase/phosoglucose isomerase [Caulobacteraceae bacterium]|jgi:transaldolase/glucose-6-phosphate isomerase|nr:bifunctional transaldolase/phosoglucose isomerase [Caulobacteraceae bacterium]